MKSNSNQTRNLTLTPGVKKEMKRSMIESSTDNQGPLFSLTDANKMRSKGSFCHLPAEILNLKNCVKRGQIKKYTHILKGFKKRYFVLTDELLTYYKDKKARGIKEKGKIALKLLKLDVKGKNEKQLIILTGTGEIELEFQSKEEKEEWVAAIEDCK
jgi:hypothetical protein